MDIIIGLGNPGKKFENTRHNVGFMAIDEFAKKNSFPEFKLDKKADSLISEQNGILLAKPETFMNESGKAAKELAKNRGVEKLVVLHDDIDLPVGKIKIVQERGSAGHKGVESIIKSIGNNGLIRIRIGIAPSRSYASEGRSEAKDVVLKNFSAEEKKLVDESITRSAGALECLIKEGLQIAMNKFN